MTEPLTPVEPDEVEQPADVTDEPAEDEPEDDAESFPREVVTKLRDENAKLRIRAKSADDLAQRLHTELVRSTGKLADPTDLPFNETHLQDTEALSAAIDALTESKPHLKARRIAGDIGQGAKSSQSEPVDLASLLRQRA